MTQENKVYESDEMVVLRETVRGLEATIETHKDLIRELESELGMFVLLDSVFYDGTYADWTMEDRIEKRTACIHNLKRQIAEHEREIRSGCQG